MTTEQTPPTTNATAQLVGGFIQALMTGGETAAESYLTLQFPILANPILQDILDWIVYDVGLALQTSIINGTTNLVINTQTSSEQTNVLNAANALQLANKSGNQEAISNALDAAKLAYQKLFNWDGTYTTPTS